EKTTINLGDLIIYTDMHRITIKGEEINLTPTEYRILELMCKNRNMVFTVEQIYENIWRNKYAVGDTSIMVHITKLRQKIEKDPKNPEYIKTVWGVGYKV
ncbi:MAG: winged helix-turn-helix domain-containing protein, partial [Clostridium sp.]